MPCAGTWRSSASCRRKGRNGINELLRIIADSADQRIPPGGPRYVSRCLARQYIAIATEIRVIDKRMLAWHRSCEASRRLEEIPGVGPIVATALVAEVGDWQTFKLWTQPCRLDRVSAEAALDRRQGSSSAGSPNKAIATCGGCSSPVPWP